MKNIEFNDFTITFREILVCIAITFYDSRFQNYFYNGKIRINKNLVDKEIVFRNGYEKTSPQVKCLVHLTKGNGKKEWGAIPGKEYYILKILKIV